MLKKRVFVPTAGSRSGCAARYLAACLVTLISACGGDDASSGNETVLHSFGATSTDGSGPGVPIQGKDGNFYGTTYGGGANKLSTGSFSGATGDGTFYMITPAGVETVLYSFGTSSTDAINPSNGVIQGTDGNFYGTTVSGGAMTDEPQGTGQGTVYRITPAGEETVIYAFGASSSDGYGPTGTLAQDSAGNLYGTTCNGCSTISGGTLFEVTPAGVETVLHTFNPSSGVDGLAPGSVILGSDGNLYGTTSSGGAGAGGIVFMITPAGAESVLYAFGNSGAVAKPGTDGSFPNGVIQGTDGNLYGTTSAGGASESNTSTGAGVFFKITLP
jgi:uncharacterized repeat protein (TIGR03803 family)